MQESRAGNLNEGELVNLKMAVLYTLLALLAFVILWKLIVLATYLLAGLAIACLIIMLCIGLRGLWDWIKS